VTRSRGLECDGCGRPVHIMEVHKYAGRLLCTECLNALGSSPSTGETSSGARLAYVIFYALGILPLTGAGACAAFTFLSAASGVPRENYAAIWDMGFFLLLPGLLLITPAIVIRRVFLRKPRK